MYYQCTDSTEIPKGKARASRVGYMWNVFVPMELHYHHCLFLKRRICQEHGYQLVFISASVSFITQKNGRAVNMDWSGYAVVLIPQYAKKQKENIVC